MNKNVLYYSLHFGEPVYYSLLYQSLQSLTKYYKQDFDIVVYWSTFETSVIQDINSYLHLGKFNLPKDFPHVKFIRSSYDKQYDVRRRADNEIKTHDGYMAKWYHLQDLFNHGYEKVFMIDADTIFFDDISSIFDLSSSKTDIWASFVYDEVLNKLNLNFEPIGSGHVIFNSGLRNSWQTFYDECIESRIDMSKRAESLCTQGVLTEKERNALYFFSEQYAPLIVLLKDGAKFKNFSDDIIVTHDRSNVFVMSNNGPADSIKYELRLNGEDIEYVNVKTKIIHYTTSICSLYTPKTLRLPYMEMHRNEYVKKYKNFFVGSTDFMERPRNIIRRPKRKPLM